ncbi:MAG: hypothetical protein OEU92_12520 [Alphaproteobacteria bacterium]|nr:hypothetical protein [Alphaproteobacteria bacterium]
MLVASPDKVFLPGGPVSTDNETEDRFAADAVLSRHEPDLGGEVTNVIEDLAYILRFEPTTLISMQQRL